MTCPPVTELCTVDASSRFEDHLRDCARCRAIVARVDSGERVPGDVMEPEHTRAAEPPPKPGGVWTFWAPGSDEYLVGAVLDVGESDVLIVPLLENTNRSADADVAFTQEVLGYPALAPVWAGDHILIEQAAEPVGVLSEALLAAVVGAYDAFFAGEQLSDPAGPPVLTDTDPRLGAHAAIVDDLRRYYSPWALLQVADELGPVLEHRREQLDVDLATLSVELDVDSKVWRAFETAEADPYESVPVQMVAKALSELQLLASRRVVTLAGAAVRAHHLPDTNTTQFAKARRRSGVRPRPSSDPVQANAAAEQYMEHLAKELGL
jgi:hypothetical protein